MEKVKYELKSEGIALIVLDDGKANAMNDVFFNELMAALDKAQNDQAKMVVFTGRPGMFSGGLDLGFLLSLQKDALVKFIEQFARAMMRVFTFPVPTIAACNGHTIAGGVMFALACDWRFISDSEYKIQMNETINGIPVPKWMLLIAEGAVSSQWQTELLLLAHTYNPKEAVRKGLFHGFLDEGKDVLEALKPQIEELSKLNLSAYEKTKQKMRNSEAIEDAIGLLKVEFD